MSDGDSAGLLDHRNTIQSASDNPDYFINEGQYEQAPQKERQVI